MKSAFVEINCAQQCKKGQIVYGDTFSSRKQKDENRVISVLSDGLGSGVKANVLSTLTATMAMNYTSNHFDIQKTADIIMKTLPVCKTRKISYATFSIVDVKKDSQVEIVEYDNPPFMLIRNQKIVPLPHQSIKLKRSEFKENELQFTSFKPEFGDRIMIFSDGVTQSGMGKPNMPLGWGYDSLKQYISNIMHENPNISARELSQQVVQKAHANDNYQAKDDISCGVIYIRQPRKLLVMTGPPFAKEKDKELAKMASNFEGQKIVCGGTTANIISRELDRSIKVNLNQIDRKIPPTSQMDGIDLVTEGTITLGHVAELLEQNKNPDYMKTNGAVQMVKHLLNSDEIHFLVGTKINEAHQDPNLPVELDIRRNIIRRIKSVLEETHLKETKLKFI